MMFIYDLNSRTANEFPISQSENDVFARAVEKTPVRCSEDSVLNSYGKKLLNMCTAFGLNILNGVVMATYRVVIHSYLTVEIA